MTSPSLVCDEVLHWAETYTGPQFHAMACDPPYEMGFMGRDWDRSGIAFRPETWKALAQHLLPGAFGLCFASARGWHRLACAIEDAGLIIHPSVFMLGWATGMGFPKATSIDDERFSGHRYGLQATKPALEPIICFQKPYQGRPVDCITATGAGALWIDGGRLSTCEYATPAGESHGWGGTIYDKHTGGYQDFSGGGATHQQGRWPPNLALVHLPTCTPLSPQQVRGDLRADCQGRRPGGFGNVGAAHGSPEPNARVYGNETVEAYACAPECPVAAFDRQAGERRSGGRGGDYSAVGFSGARGGGERVHDSAANIGPASRFMYTADWSLDVAEQLAQADPVFYTGKASRSERDEGLAGLAPQVLPEHDRLVGTTTFRHDVRVQGGGYPVQKLPQRNRHACVKPIALCQWLATLLLPPAAYAPRRLLNPFAGSGSEAIGATLAGWEEIVGIEQDPATVAVGTRRLHWWTTQIAAQLSLWPS